MTMQTDVKSAHLSAAGSYYAGRTRLKGIVVNPKASTAATFEIRDGSAGSRKKSFCARMSGMKKKLTSAKTANDPNSRINKSLRAWNC
ncbi:MAG: hypothetical protein EBR82_62650 [Caulobacteraceae bacterium]|nr:hypothetical protein [Caulobacteraceae bacterium]